jgi:hypothetical protein
VEQNYDCAKQYVFLQRINGKMNSNKVFWATILIAAFWTGALQVSAQTTVPAKLPANFVFVPKKPVADPFLYPFQLANHKLPQSKPKVDFYQNLPAPVSPALSMQQWGWFCRAEYKFQQTTKLPLYLRLGSKEQADRLEGK